MIHKPVDPDDPDTTIPVIGVVDERQAAILTADGVVREASNKAVQVNHPPTTLAQPHEDIHSHSLQAGCNS